MKYTTIIFIIASVAIIQISCKKDDKKNSLPAENSQERTEIQIPTSGILVDMVDDGSSITLLMQEGDHVKVVKMNTNGELLWEKSYTEIDGLASYIIRLDNGTMAFTTSSIIYDINFQTFFGWFLESTKCDTTYVQSDYSLRSDSVREYLNPTGFNNLVKIDGNGNIIWNKSLSQASRDVRISYSDSKIYMALNFSLNRTSYNLDRRFGGQYPVITYNFFNGQMEVEAYDAANGNLINKNELNKETVGGFKSPSYVGFKDYPHNPYNFHMLSGAENSFVSYSQGFVRIENGVLTHINGPFKVCDNDLEYHQIISAGRDSKGLIYLTGLYNSGGEDIGYVAALNADGSLAWQKSLTSNLGSSEIVTSQTKSGFYIKSDFTVIEKYNQNGALLSSHSEGSFIDGEVSLIKANPTGVTYVYRSRPNDVKLVRLNL